MNSGNSPQTLFRFVSLRNPNLLDTTKSNLGFIIRPEKMESVFDQVIATAGQSKLDSLQQAAASFKPISSVKTLETGSYGMLINIGKALENEKPLLKNEIETCVKKHAEFISKELDIKLLWDNLIYQYITQNNVSVSENITFILKALHVGYAQTLTSTADLQKINGTDFLKASLNAEIVIPKNIFEKNSSNIVAARLSTEKPEITLSDRENIKLTTELDRQESIQ
jgi:hypothetical protein